MQKYFQGDSMIQREFWTVKEVAEYLRLTPRTVREMVNHPGNKLPAIPFVRVCSRLRFPIQSVKDWLNSQSSIPL
ncbi:helix-turn-helix domain-containing protein [Planctomicrobium sp. SH661]|uniref:helix-turn-helix domain-containing protein n=1 Tax=Planctomicrobium sp. SH661 TaxID=3448124 RepID=UPI003F5C351F